MNEGGRKKGKKREREREKNSAFSAFLFFARESLGYGKLILQSYGASHDPL